MKMKISFWRMIQKQMFLNIEILMWMNVWIWFQNLIDDLLIEQSKTIADMQNCWLTNWTNLNQFKNENTREIKHLKSFWMWFQKTNITRQKSHRPNQYTEILQFLCRLAKMMCEKHNQAKSFYLQFNQEKMNQMNVYQELTYIETYDWNVKTTTASIDVISKLLNEQQFINLWNELLNRSNIKRVFTKELSDVDKLIYSIDDKTIRMKIQADIEKRIKDWLRVNVEIVQNLLSKY